MKTLRPPPPPPLHSPEFRRVYVWQLPVRLWHWMNALCILVLTVTGILIAHPPAIASASEASFSYWFGINRFIHFLFAYIFLAGLAVRIYWGFVGNHFADWRNFIPMRRAQFRQMLDVLRVDVLQAQDKPIMAVGHNAVAYLTYFMLFWVFLFQIVSGFAMYASMSKSWFPQLFVWIVPLFGGDYALREWHYIAMWFFILFTLIHVYLTFYHDYVEGHGVMSSMVGGWKFLHADALREDGKSWFTLKPSARGKERLDKP